MFIEIFIRFLESIKNSLLNLEKEPYDPSTSSGTLIPNRFLSLSKGRKVLSLNSTKSFGRTLFLACFLLLFPFTSFAETFPEKPKTGNFIVDEVSMINTQDASMINQVSSKLLQEKKIPIFIVTIESLAKYGFNGDINNYATNLFNHWGIGRKDYNYGILLLVSKSDRKARIEFGGSFDHQYDNAALNIMNSVIIPNFKNGNFSGGLLAGANSLDAMARDANLLAANAANGDAINGIQNHESLTSTQRQQDFHNQSNSFLNQQSNSSNQISSASSLFLMVGFIALVAFIAYSLFKNGKKGWAWVFLAAVGLLILFMLRSGSRSDFDGGGFGGGSGDGGGASGSW